MILNYDQMKKRVSVLVNLSNTYKNKKNFGMAKSLLCEALELALQNRDKCSKSEKQKREALAKTIIPQGNPTFYKGILKHF